jgi:Galactose oxidase, central domain
VTWFNDVWCFDPRINQWAEQDCIGFVPSPREGHAAALVGDYMYVFGGRNEEGLDLGDLSAFRISTKRWFSFHNMGPAPSPRSGHSMTAYGRQIIVLAGEPSSAPRDPTELSMAYILDTAKIRFPNDSAPNGERATDVRKMSGDRSAIPTGRVSREAQNTPPIDQPRRTTASYRESMISPSVKVQGDASQGAGAAGSRLPRASIAQAPSGPPPPGQAPTPTPRMNGQGPQAPRSKTPPTKQDRNVGPQVDTIRSVAIDRDVQSPTFKVSPMENNINNKPREDISPVSGGRRTPNIQPPSKLAAKAMEAGEAAPLMSAPTRQRSLQKQRQRASMDSTDESVLGRQPSVDGSIESRNYRNSRTLGDEPRSPRLTPHQEALIKELEATRNRNAWYASELALARKAGYNPSPSSSSVLDERPPEVFTDEDRPLIEAFLSMRAELAKMQATVDRQAAIASKRVAEVEHQRDAAISEAAYARAKLAAHGGSQRSTPQLEGTSRADDEANTERTTDLSRRLALALASQTELKSKLEAITVDLDQEKRARELAEGTNEATRKRLAELEMQNHSLELESLKAELHELQAHARQESALRSEAEANHKQVSIDKEELSQKLEETSTRLKDHGSNMTSLREAVAASADKASLMERHLEEERERREGLERKLLQLRSDHEERTAELETASRRLKEAEELAESHAREAESHKLAFISGLDRASSLDSDSSIRSITDQRVLALQSQVETANKLAKSNQAAADDAADKLRRAEERIAGLEAYQEQVSREGLHLRRQLQTAIKESQSSATENKELKSQLESQQRDTSALAIQHGALKDLLGERGVHASDSRRSPLLDSPGSRFGTPEQSRLRDLEQQLQASLKSHEETKVAFESREQETDRAYREKLEQLENDYQAAVHYVKGTEKMLKRMKDELARYKTLTTTLQTELESAQKNAEQSADSAASASWESERTELQNSLAELQNKMSSSMGELEGQISKLREDLTSAQAECHDSRSAHEIAKQELITATDKSRMEIEQLKEENSLLESRAVHAEQRVTMLLEQMVTSVDNHRRHSQHGQGFSSISRTQSNASTATAGAAGGGRSRGNSNVSRDDSFLDNRSSMALDSLANELDALRSHWESTNRNHRLSSTFDLDPTTPTKESHHESGTLSQSVTNWRRRLEEEEARAISPTDSFDESMRTPTAAISPEIPEHSGSNMI